jgi:hypothetical protein
MMFPIEACYVLGAIAAIVVTILLYVKVLPRKLDGTFDNKFVQFLHDFFHFKKLYIEEVLKFIFVLATVACVCEGAFLVLGYQERWSYYGGTSKESTIGLGLALLVGGPVALRLSYEMLMMFILAVKNVMEINNKMPKNQEQEVEEPKAEEAAVSE